jgi:hypothetical protein
LRRRNELGSKKFGERKKVAKFFFLDESSWRVDLLIGKSVFGE